MTFFNGRGEVVCELSYRELRAQAMHAARRLLGLVDVNRGDRIALVAETRSEFVILFFACQYAGLVPVPIAGYGEPGWARTVSATATVSRRKLRRPRGVCN